MVAGRGEESPAENLHTARDHNSEDDHHFDDDEVYSIMILMILMMRRRRMVKIQIVMVTGVNTRVNTKVLSYITFHFPFTNCNYNL